MAKAIGAGKCDWLVASARQIKRIKKRKCFSTPVDTTKRIHTEAVG
jgi:hypothetical protein